MTLEDRIEGRFVTNHYDETFILKRIDETWHRCFENDEKWAMTLSSVLMTLKVLQPYFYNEIREEFPEEFI